MRIPSEVIEALRVVLRRCSNHPSRYAAILKHVHWLVHSESPPEVDEVRTRLRVITGLMTDVPESRKTLEDYLMVLDAEQPRRTRTEYRVGDVSFSNLAYNVVHEYDDHGNHRITTWSSSLQKHEGSWVGYQGLAELEVLGRRFMATTDFYGEGLWLAVGTRL